MLNLSVEVREKEDEKAKNLVKKGILPAVLYGPKIKTMSLKVRSKEFLKVLAEAGESSLVSLQIEGRENNPQVLIHDISRDFLTGNPVHIDFYQPILTEEVEASVSLIFEGVALAEKDLGGILVKRIQEIEVRALPQKLPREIRVNVEGLKTFEDEILVSDLELPEGVVIEKGHEEVVAIVVPPREEEIEEPIEEKVEEVERVSEQKEGEPAEKESEQETSKE